MGGATKTDCRRHMNVRDLLKVTPLHENRADLRRSVRVAEQKTWSHGV